MFPLCLLHWLSHCYLEHFLSCFNLPCGHEFDTGDRRDSLGLWHWKSPLNDDIWPRDAKLYEGESTNNCKNELPWIWGSIVAWCTCVVTWSSWVLIDNCFWWWEWPCNEILICICVTMCERTKGSESTTPGNAISEANKLSRFDWLMLLRP